MGQRLRVVHLVPALFSHDDGIVGGAERYVFELARSMADETPTSLLTFGNRDRCEFVGNLHIRVIGQPWHVRGLRTNPFSFRLLEELSHADVIHCHQQHVLASSAAAIFGRLAARKVFVTDLGGGGWDISAFLSTDRWYHGHLHLSEYSRKYYGHSTSSRAYVIYGGVDTLKFSPSESLKRESTVVFVGRIRPHKGIEHLIAAIPEGVQLEVIGREFDPGYLSDLRRLAEGKRVTFRHDCDDDAIIDAYRRAICVVLPSVYRTMYGDDTRVPELLGQTLLEAMACAAPTLASRVASLPEIVKDGETGFIVPPNDPAALHDKIRLLADDEDKVREFGEAARKRVIANFAWPAVVNRCLEIYGS